MFLDNDQFVGKAWLPMQLAILNRGFDMIGVEARQMSRDFMPGCRNERLTEWYSYVGCGGMCIRRDVVEATGKFDEQFNPSYFEDPDYCFRSANAGFKIAWNYKARIFHMPHQTLGKVSDKAKRFTRSHSRFRRKWQDNVPPTHIMPHVPEFDW